jgi:hypothetical protein
MKNLKKTIILATILLSGVGLYAYTINVVGYGSTKQAAEANAQQQCDAQGKVNAYGWCSPLKYEGAQIACYMECSMKK